MMRRAMMAALVVAALASAAWADEVVLRTGQKIVGIAREEGDRILVEVPLGTIGFAKSDVVSITPGRTVLHEYRDKADACAASKKALDFVELARWARQNGLTRFVRANLEKALELDPSNEFARRDLGYTLYKGKWMTEEEVRKEQGFMWFEGRWMTAMEMQLTIRKKLDAEAAKVAAQDEKKRKKEEERQAKAQALQNYYDELAERERQKREWRRVPTWNRWYGRGYGPYRGAYGWGDAVPTFDIVALLKEMGFKFGK